MRQRLGQHFLQDVGVVQTIVAAAELSGNETVLEIGPGQGALTQALLDRARTVVAVELDERLAQGLRTRWGQHPRFQLHLGDILKQEWDVLVPAAARPVKVLGNLPYAITSPIFEKLMPWTGWESGVFLIQREVADRIVSPPGSRAFGILSLAIQLFATAERMMTVPPDAFSPPPEVTSSVIRLRRKIETGLAPEQVEAFFDLAHGAFAHRRKTIANSLALHAETDKNRVAAWLKKNGVAAESRAETLGLDEYRRLASPWAIFRRETKLTSSPATSTIPRT
jgi:16S rRNA (adenine1518-N6/adenine1519-N6)-dimethyltransferase